MKTAHPRRCVVGLIAGAALAACAGDAAQESSPLVNSPVVIGADTLRPQEIRSYLAAELGFTSRGGTVFCSFSILGRDGEQLYVGTLCEELVPTADSLTSGSGRGGPVALVLDTVARPLRIVGHRTPRDGSLHSRDVREIFPRAVQRRIFAAAAQHEEEIRALRRANREAARTP